MTSGDWFITPSSLRFIVNVVDTMHGNSLKDNEPINTLLLLPVKAFDALVTYPVRLSIMNTLINGPLTVTDVSSRLKLAKGIVHRHLRVLEKLGWVTVASDEVLRILNLPREANRVYYMLSSLIYFGYSVVVNGCEVQLKVDGKYAAFIDSRKGVLIVKTPTATYGCVKSCANSSECFNWALRVSKKFKVQIETSGRSVDEALVQLFHGILIKGFTSPKAKLPLIKIIDLKIDNVYRQWLGNPIRVNNNHQA